MAALQAVLEHLERVSHCRRHAVDARDFIYESRSLTVTVLDIFDRGETTVVTAIAYNSGNRDATVVSAYLEALMGSPVKDEVITTSKDGRA